MSSAATEQPSNCEAHLHAANVEIESLKQALHEKQSQLVAMETACLRESDRQVELEDSVIAWQDKYDRLYESHKRVQKVNQSLEDKLLKLVDRNTGERAQLTSDVATLSVRLAQANFNIAKLQREIERYKADINLAIQLLQCKPDSFMPQKVSSLPIDIQSKVSAYMRLETNSHSDSEGSTSGVGVTTTASYKVLPASDSPPPAPCPFPPTAMVYSMRGLDAKPAVDNDSTLNHNNNNNINNNNNNLKEPTQNNSNNNATTCNSSAPLNVSASNAIGTASTSLTNANGLTDPDMISPIVMAKFLEDELKAGEVKHCDTCQCSKQDLTVLADVSRSYTVATQTPFPHMGGSGTLNEPLAQLCLRCHSNLNSPSRTNSPYLMKLVKSSDSVISETKSSVSDLNDLDKLFTPAKKDDLMVNPILGHHRLCDRTSGSGALALALAAQQQQQQQQLQLQQNGGKLNATMLYPTTHLGAYAAEKYLLETSSLAALGSGAIASGIGQLKNGYQRRFLDGGGSALELLNNTPKKGGKLLEMNGNDDGEDEAKPLLSGVSHTNLLDMDKLKGSVEVAELALAASGAVEQQLKSPASTCSAANAKPHLMKSPITGSVNSLWSKTSSCEGAKMFENFNRNLIKTIKAENPKYRGPRLCAMRIQQNGQSNILLDNIESIEAVTPIIYKRRERLLDEELDDTKDIITSKSTMMPTPPRNEQAAATADGKLVDAVSIQADAWDKNASTQAQRNEIEAECQVTVVVANCVGDSGGGDEGGGSGGGECNGGVGVAAAMELNTLVNGDTSTEQKTASTEVDTKSCGKLNAAIGDATTPAAAELNANATVNLMDLQTTLPAAALEKHSPSYEILQNESSSKNSLNSKSCTQSSSISDVIDFQENVILRRQQLSRVAEWVQNNTQQLEQQQQQQQQQQQHQQVMRALNNCDSSGTDRQSSFSTLDQLDSVSMEKLSMDSGYKTTPQPQTNGYQADDANKSTEDSLSPKTDTNSSHNNKNNNNNNNNNLPYNHYNHQYSQPLVPLQQQQQQQKPQQHPITNTYYRRTTRSGLPVAYTTPDPNAENGYCYSNTSNNNNNNCAYTTLTSPEQPTCDILNYKYYPSDTDKTRAIKAELHTTTQSVDIAQMEYNVKQFLLKQNEWSMRCSARSGTKGTNTTTTSSNLSSATSQATLSQKAAQATPKLLRHTKLFSGAGVGPGVGERVRSTIAMAASAQAAQAAAEGGLAADATTSVVQQPAALPQRTETNL